MRRRLRLWWLWLQIRFWDLVKEVGWRIFDVGDEIRETAEGSARRESAKYTQAELEQLGPEGPAREYNRAAAGRIERIWL